LRNGLSLRLMKLKRLIILLQVTFLLVTFGAATFYFQYAFIKNKTDVSTTQDSRSEKSCFPIAEEESGNQSTGEEEEQDEDRVFHESKLNLLTENVSVITFATVPTLEFKEIHFEIVTPPPQS
jgi:hypothetical protein